jgi:hypothetical protein
MLFELDHQNCSVRDFQVVPVPFTNVRQFIDKWHYSHSRIPTIRHAFALMHDNDMIGAIAYGLMPMKGAWKAYTDYGVTKETDVLDLRRLCCIDDTPRNTESYFIGKTIKWIKKNTDYKIIVSYADPHHGHAGTIYKASNFKYLGTTSPGKVIVWNDKCYHDKTVRDYSRSHFRKTGEKIPVRIAVELKSALESGEAHYITTPGKHIYVYHLR